MSMGRLDDGEHAFEFYIVVFVIVNVWGRFGWAGLLAGGRLKRRRQSEWHLCKTA